MKELGDRLKGSAERKLEEMGDRLKGSAERRLGEMYAAAGAAGRATVVQTITEYQMNKIREFKEMFKLADSVDGNTDVEKGLVTSTRRKWNIPALDPVGFSAPFDVQTFPFDRTLMARKAWVINKELLADGEYLKDEFGFARFSSGRFGAKFLLPFDQ